MVEIISKRDGPRREDARIKRLLQENRGTIAKIADQISNGNYSASKQPKPQPRPQGLMIHVLGAAKVQEPRPAVRVSVNGRVVLYDESSGRQIHHLGDVRRRDGAETFVLATRDNGFFAALDETLAQALLDLDGSRLDPVDGDRQLAALLRTRLGIRSSS